MKKFYENVEYKKDGEVYKIYLDGNELKTPMKNELSFVSEAVASKIAGEWESQSDVIKPEIMPFNRYANSIVDRIAPNREAVIDELISYAEGDVICYRDAENSELLSIQDKKWNPILEWLDKEGMYFEITYDVFPIDQDKKSTEILKSKLEDLSIETLSLFYFASALTKSTLLSYAFISNHISSVELFELSMLEELWQAENWGKEEEAEENREKIKSEVNCISEYLELL